jgi:hypothetical protein
MNGENGSAGLIHLSARVLFLRYANVSSFFFHEQEVERRAIHSQGFAPQHSCTVRYSGEEPALGREAPL